MCNKTDEVTDFVILDIILVVYYHSAVGCEVTKSVLMVYLTFVLPHSLRKSNDINHLCLYTPRISNIFSMLDKRLNCENYHLNHLEAS